eukprot:TRINITY_DN74_c0_g1_i4.p1 TRINITY_DN74_c0_g1~~TRINITY_DN74_c0_g1_i4.p1  ORF type:complete len:384 (+),score=119.65 TRINITY_DN74_c0_g1_i4:181-1332(+)
MCIRDRFKAVPCLLEVFNSTNQAKGEQPARLFSSVAEAASAALSGRDVDQEMVDLIAHKHCALNVQGVQYSVVGEHLLGTIQELLTDDQTVLDAWGELYGKLAEVQIAEEEKLYQAAESKPGGWRGLREFEIAKQEMMSSTIARITLEPSDGQPVSAFTSGQFTTVWAKPPESEHGQPRHYTLNLPRNPIDYGKHYAISVRRQGLMSNFLHEAEIGTKVKLSAPYGVFNIHGAEEVWLSDPDAPVVFLSAGVGLTPTMAMLESLDGRHPDAPITWLHAAKSGDEHAYRPRLISMAEENPLLSRRVWYEEPVADDGMADPDNNLAKFHYNGRMDLSVLDEHVMHANHHKTNYYFCGPPEWMEKVRRELEDHFNIPRNRIHFESF